MLADYDAIAVAEVMGLAFVRSLPGKDEAGPGESGTLGDTDGATSVIHVDDADILVVVMQTMRGAALVDRSNRRGDRRHDFGKRRVSSPTSIFIERAVEKGLPRNALRNVAEWLAGDDQAKIAPLEWRVVPKTTLERRDARLSPQESERTERIARLSVQAQRVLGTQAEAREFMTSPHPELDGRSPVDAARTDLGGRRAERLLAALEYGLAL